MVDIGFRHLTPRTARTGGTSARLGAAVGGAAGVAHAARRHRSQGQLTYQDRIRDFHRQLRVFYYGYLFTDRPFGSEDFGGMPKFDPRPVTR